MKRRKIQRSSLKQELAKKVWPGSDNGLKIRMTMAAFVVILYMYNLEQKRCWLKEVRSQAQT